MCLRSVIAPLCCFPLESRASLAQVFKYDDSHTGTCLPNAKEQAPKIQKAHLKLRLVCFLDMTASGSIVGRLLAVFFSLQNTVLLNYLL